MEPNMKNPKKFEQRYELLNGKILTKKARLDGKILMGASTRKTHEIV